MPIRRRGQGRRHVQIVLGVCVSFKELLRDLLLPIRRRGQGRRHVQIVLGCFCVPIYISTTLLINMVSYGVADMFRSFSVASVFLDTYRHTLGTH